MSTRAPPIAPSDLSPEQKNGYDSMSETASTVFKDKFVYKREDGAFIGPFAAFCYTPAAGEAFFQVMKALAKIPGLPQYAREVAILATGSHFKAAYEIYSHERIAIGTELKQDQIDKIKHGEKPGDLQEIGNVAFDVTMELLKKPGPLAEEKWKEAEKAFGREGAMALVHYVGYYAYTSLLLNGLDIQLPEGESIKNEGTKWKGTGS